MITLINATAFRSDAETSTSLTPGDCQNYLANYVSGKVRLWAYHASLSRLALRIGCPPDKHLHPIDLAFVGLADVRCPVHWIFGGFEVIENVEWAKTSFAVPSAGVSFSASDLIIVVQNEWPDRCWEFGQDEKCD